VVVGLGVGLGLGVGVGVDIVSVDRVLVDIVQWGNRRVGHNWVLADSVSHTD